MLAASTPGVVRSRSTSAICACLPGFIEAREAWIDLGDHAAVKEEKPGSAVTAVIALIRNSPPVARRSTESATWPMTSALPMRIPPG